MRIVFIYLFILFPSSLFGQERTFPSLKSSASSLIEFIPINWEIYDISSGDLNNDGEKDYAIILQGYDSIRHVTDEFYVSYDQPRMLVVLLRESLSSKYVLAYQNNKFIPTFDGHEFVEEPIKGIYIDNDTLRISLYQHLRLGAPGHWLYNLEYRFKIIDNDLKLIMANNHHYDFKTKTYTNYRFDFMTKTLELIKGDDNLQKREVKSKILNTLELKSLKDLGRAFTWIIDQSYL